MSGTKTCNKCGHKNLGWDYGFNKITKKWKLENHKRNDGKWCNKPPDEKWKKAKKSDYLKCKLCTGNGGHLLTESGHERFPHTFYETMEEHLLRYHPNGEIRDEIEMMVLTDEEKADMRISWKCPDPNTT